MDTTQPFNIGEVLKEGWRLTKEHLGFLIGYQMILFALMLIFSAGEEGIGSSVWHTLGWLIVMLAKMGLMNAVLMITIGLKPGFDQLYQNWPLLFNWVVAYFLFSLMFLIGLALFVIPGLYVMATYGLFPFFILDKKVGPIEALKLAAKATQGIRWKMFLLFMACIGLSFLGLLFFGVGLLIATPVVLLALATVYRVLTKHDWA